MKVNLAAYVGLHSTYSIIVPSMHNRVQCVYLYIIYICMHFCIILICMQVLSSSVSVGFEFIGKEEFEETAKFCKMFDKFFDCLNTRRSGEGREKRKPDLEPYRSDKDVRFDVCDYRGRI